MTPTLAPHFQQIPLCEGQHGLAKPIAVLRLEPAEISSRLPVIFEPERDDLDELLGAVIESGSGRQFGLVRHRHAPGSGTTLLINERSTDFRAELFEALALLRLDVSQLSWVHPNINLAGD